MYADDVSIRYNDSQLLIDIPIMWPDADWYAATNNAPII